MRNGIVLPSYIYKPDRVELVRQTFQTLEKTETDESNKPKLLLILKLTDSYYYDTGRLLDAFDVEVIPDPEEVKGTEQTLAYGTQYLFDQGMDTVTWMGDDAMFNPGWITELRELIARHPDARAWSVYRSAYTDVHQTVEETECDVQVTSVCGHGFTVSQYEWSQWRVDWKAGAWDSPYGDTLDMHHIYVRPGGERWVTKVSWVEHTGKVGLHCREHIPEYAQNFQGIESMSEVKGGSHGS